MSTRRRADVAAVDRFGKRVLVSYMPLARANSSLASLALEAVTTAMFRSQLDTSSLIPISSDMVDKSDEETAEEETQVEQTSAASLAWVLDTCAEAVVELTDAEDFADACIAAGPAHHGRLMTGAATRLLLRANRERVIAQGSGWAENEKPFELTVSQHLAAVREWIAFEEDGRGTSADGCAC